MNVTAEEYTRFEKFVRITPDCWLWTGSKHPAGYGSFYDASSKRTVRAHRAAWAFAHGKMPPKHLFVCHKCDNPPCVNPEHLFVGTCRDNTRDAWNKGRLPMGNPEYQRYIRSFNPTAQPRSHCKHGHPYSGENVYLSRNRKFRICRTCQTIRGYKRYPNAVRVSVRKEG